MSTLDGGWFDNIAGDDFVPDFAHDEVTAEIRVEDPNWPDKKKARYTGLGIEQIRAMREERS